MAPDPLTSQELYILSMTERVNSGVSMLGILFILTTYLFFPLFDKPINRLIFFATWSNLGVAIAYFISVDGFNLGNESLCKLQAFLLQMFLGVDAYWAFCMAFNVYLAFFRGWTVAQFRALDLKYLMACYGLAFIPAFILIFINSSGDKGPVYGQAAIWCWIAPEYDWLRFVVMYGFIWAALLFSFVVYIFAARVIWKKRAQLNGYLNPWNEAPFATIITTEVEVTSESRNADNTPIHKDPAAEFGSGSDDDNQQYTVTVESDQPKLPAALNVRSVTREVAANEANAESWLYARVAFLFFFALAITWLPASVNRIYGLILTDTASFPLAYVSSFVFPLQGFWNVLVYVVTSRTACKQLWATLCGRGARVRVDSGPQRYKKKHTRHWDAEEEDIHSATMRLTQVPSRDRRHRYDTAGSHNKKSAGLDFGLGRGEYDFEQARTVARSSLG